MTPLKWLSRLAHIISQAHFGWKHSSCKWGRQSPQQHQIPRPGDGTELKIKLKIKLFVHLEEISLLPKNHYLFHFEVIF